MTEPILQDVKWDIDYKIHVGTAWSRFLRGLADQEVWGSTCQGCSRTYVPPQAFCESCFEAITDWKTVEPVGTLHAATIVYQGFAGGPEAPYAVGAIKLDETDSLLMHFIGGVDLSDPEIARATLSEGLRVKAVWRDHREANILDIEHFVPAPNAP